MNEQPILPQQQEESSIDAITLHDIIQIFFTNWRWFLLSVILCLGVAYLYLASTPSVYKREATLLIKDSRKGGDLDITTFSDLAGFQSRRNVDNELYILQSRRLMMEVVSRLGLTTSYTTNQGLQTVELYKSSPVEVAFVNADPQYGCALTVTPLDENEFEATAFEDRFSEGRVSRQKITGNYGDTISTPVGKLVVTKTPYLDSTSMRRTIAVGKRSLEATATTYRKAVQSSIVN